MTTTPQQPQDPTESGAPLAPRVAGQAPYLALLLVLGDLLAPPASTEPV